MNWCKIGLHKYNLVGEQDSINLVRFFSGVRLNRIVHICELCDKIKYTSHDISLSRNTLLSYSDSNLWKPDLDFTLEYRKIKINKIRKLV